MTAQKSIFAADDDADDNFDIDGIPGIETGSVAGSRTSVFDNDGDFEVENFGDLGGDQPVSLPEAAETDTGFPGRGVQIEPENAVRTQRAPRRPLSEPPVPIEDGDFDEMSFGEEDDFPNSADEEQMSDETRSPASRFQKFILPGAASFVALAIAVAAYAFFLPSGNEKTSSLQIPVTSPIKPLPAAGEAPQGASAPSEAPAPASIEVPAEASAALLPPKVEKAVEQPGSMIAADMKAMSDRLDAIDARVATSLADIGKAQEAGKTEFLDVQSSFSSRMAALETAISEIRSDLTDLKKFRAIQTQKNQVAVAAPQPARAPAPKVDTDNAPPLKPAIIESYVLKGVAQNAAWLDSGRGIVKVSPGDALPGAGVVKSIRQSEGTWMVVTSLGIIRP